MKLKGLSIYDLYEVKDEERGSDVYVWQTSKELLFCVCGPWIDEGDFPCANYRNMIPLLILLGVPLE